MIALFFHILGGIYVAVSKVRTPLAGGVLLCDRLGRRASAALSVGDLRRGVRVS